MYVPSIKDKILFGKWSPFDRLILPKINKFLIENDHHNFENYLLWCEIKINYQKIVSECVNHEHEILKNFNIWNSKIVPLYLVEYKLHNNKLKYFKYEVPKNALGLYLEDYFENNNCIFGVFDKQYNHEHEFLPKGIDYNQLIHYYNHKFKYKIQYFKMETKIYQIIQCLQHKVLYHS